MQSSTDSLTGLYNRRHFLESLERLLGTAQRHREPLALLLVARARAVLDGRDFVTPEDVKQVAVAALAHRITLNPQTWASGLAAADVVGTLLSTVPGPAATASA